MPTQRCVHRTFVRLLIGATLQKLDQIFIRPDRKRIYESLMHFQSKSNALRCFLESFTIFSMSRLAMTVSDVSYARRYALALRAYRRTLSNVSTSGSMAASMVAWTWRAMWPVCLLKCSFALPHEYSTPTPSSSGWHFGDISVELHRSQIAPLSG